MGLIQRFGPGEAFALRFFFFFVTLNPTKLGFHSPHPQVLPLLNLWSAAPDRQPASLRCCRGDAQLLRLALRRSDLVCPDAEHAASAGGASCEGTAAIWAEKGEGLLWSCWSSPWEQRPPLSPPALPPAPLNGAERHCTGL